MTKEFFRQKGIAFQEFDLSTDKAAVTRMLRLTRQKRVPVIQKGEKFVVGFEAGEIEKLIISQVLTLNRRPSSRGNQKHSPE
ncbi:MAG: glutaredoxin family protein [Deltaproteobacteria bacterium]|nr:glutaredoxin family protein [Deltaproteobacteria bacterium]